VEWDQPVATDFHFSKVDIAEEGNTKASKVNKDARFQPLPPFNDDDRR
jgi:hypothetical protein